MSRLRALGLSTAALLVLTLLGAGAAGASTGPAGQDAYSATVTTKQLAQLRSSGYDVTEMTVSAAGKTVVPLVGTRRQMRALRKFGIRPRLVKRYASRSVASGYTVYRTYSEPGGIADEMRALARDYPRITNPAGGACATAGGTMRCQQIRIRPGGQVFLCDPAAAVDDNRACPP